MKKCKKFIPILLTSFVAAGGCCNLVACNEKPAPESPTFNVKFSGDATNYTVDNTTADINTDFVVTITPAQDYNVTNIVVKNSQRIFNNGVEYSLDGLTITIHKEYLATKDIEIQVSLEYDSKTYDVRFGEGDLQAVSVSSTIGVVGEPFVMDFVVTKPSVNYKSVIIKSDNKTLDPTKDYEIDGKSITVHADAIKNKDLLIDFNFDTYTPEQFISNRTFSLWGTCWEGSEPQDSVWGTGWIIDDATPDIPDDYIYHVATNWHVIYSMLKKQQGHSEMSYYFTDQSKAAAGQLTDESYYLLGKSSDDQTTTKFKIEPNEDVFKYPTSSNINGIRAIDLYEIDIDFTGAAGYIQFTSIENKLKNLNNYRFYHTYINKFVNGESVKGADKYMGGYPRMKAGSGPFIYWQEWQSKKLSGAWEWRNERGVDVNPDDLNNLIHFIDGTYYPEPHESLLADYSPQAIFKDTTAQEYLKQGASGSMVVTTNCETCGIYWGYHQVKIDADKQYWPAISVFKTADKNFLEKYIH